MCNILNLIYHCVCVCRAHICDAALVKTCNSVVNFDDRSPVHWVSAQREAEVIWCSHKNVFNCWGRIFINFIKAEVNVLELRAL